MLTEEVFVVKKIISLIALVSLMGCASTSNKQVMMDQLQLRIGDLERQTALKTDQINALQYDVDRLNAEVERQARIKKQQVKRGSQVRRIESNGIIRVSVSPKQVQAALKKAGYYEGAVDNKIGQQTKDSIVKFQKDHELKADGIIGLKTWSELETYL